MASSKDEQAATILREINKPQPKKRTSKAGESTSRNKKSIDKNQEQHQEDDPDDTIEEDEDSLNKSSKALSLIRNEQLLEVATRKSLSNDIEKETPNVAVTSITESAIEGNIGKQKKEKIANKKNRTANKKTKHIPKYFEYLIDDGKGKFYFDSNSGQTLLNWGVATYKRIIHPDYYVDNTALNIFLFAVQS